VALSVMLVIPSTRRSQLPTGASPRQKQLRSEPQQL
jgi:hypothetical protein